jgi:UDP-hydrolysing UDP-N-acetyl-D-glucosamine 2-epimerase
MKPDMSRSRSICVVTGSRADYGHLSPVMHAIAADPNLVLHVVACGQHLDARFGETWEDIAKDGFDISEKVDIDLTEDTSLAIAAATGTAISRLAQAFARLKPDIILVLGDRFEIFSAGAAATILRIPLAHIHGGEVTEAAMDDAMRHSLTKMAALHFVAAKPYAERVLQMGEDPGCVFVTGAPGLDHLDTLDFMTREKLAQDLGVSLSARFFIVTYHPVTLESDYGTAAIAQLATALENYPKASIVFTGVNSDPGHTKIQTVLTTFCAADPDRRRLVQSLGQRRYLSALKEADVVIGNSSSGLIEAPSLFTPSVNIGNRQKGRLRSPSVINCGNSAKDITNAINQALSLGFLKSVAAQEPAYDHRKEASARIVAVLKTTDLARLSIKRFRDIITAS